MSPRIPTYYIFAFFFFVLPLIFRLMYRAVLEAKSVAYFLGSNIVVVETTRADWVVIFVSFGINLFSRGEQSLFITIFVFM